MIFKGFRNLEERVGFLATLLRFWQIALNGSPKGVAVGLDTVEIVPAGLDILIDRIECMRTERVSRDRAKDVFARHQ